MVIEIFPLKKNGLFSFCNNFGTSEYLILSSFFPRAKEQTIKELQKKSGYSYERVYSALEILERNGIVSKKKAGKTLIYSINTNRVESELAFVHFALIKKLVFFNKYPNLKRLLEEFLDKIEAECVIVFGSYSRGEASKNSDLDLICVGENKDIEKIALSLRHKYNVKLNPVVVKRKDFKNIKKENSELWRELRESGIILFGYGLFYYFYYRCSI